MNNDFHRRALTTLAEAVLTKLNEIAPAGEQRRRNLEALFSRIMPANQWLDFFCPHELAPDFGNGNTSFSALLYTHIPGSFEALPRAFRQLCDEVDKKEGCK